MIVGDRVITPFGDINAVITGGPYTSLFGGKQYVVELDEFLPYYGLPNPRRKMVFHESHLEAKEN